jgi:hypothetical protein
MGRRRPRRLQQRPGFARPHPVVAAREGEGIEGGLDGGGIYGLPPSGWEEEEEEEGRRERFPLFVKILCYLQFMIQWSVFEKIKLLFVKF